MSGAVWDRLPGLFRRFELDQVTGGDPAYRIEPAGKQDCGVELFAIYVRLDALDEAELCGIHAEPHLEVPAGMTCPRCWAGAEEFELVPSYNPGRAVAYCMVCNYETEIDV